MAGLAAEADVAKSDNHAYGNPMSWVLGSRAHADCVTHAGRVKSPVALGLLLLSLALATPASAQQQEGPDEINLPERITTPYEVSVCSTLDTMVFHWTSSEKFEGQRLNGEAPVESVFSEEQDCWKHTAKLTAPKGRLRITFSLWDRQSNDPSYSPAYYEYERRTTVVDSTQKSFSDFKTRTECTEKVSKWRFMSRLYYLALVATKWRVRQQAWVKRGGSWRLVRSRTRRGSTVPDAQMYSVKNYGWSALVLKGAKFRKFDDAVREGKAKVTQSVRVKDKASGRVLKNSKSKVRPGDSGC